MNSDDALVLRGVFVDDLRASVGRTIIDENNFDVFEGLAQNAVDALAEIFFYFVNWDNNGDFDHNFIIAYLEEISNYIL